MLQSEKTWNDKPRKVFSSSTGTSELEGGYRLTRDRSVLHSDLENEILRCVLLRIPQSAPSFRELRPWPGCVANFRRNSRNSRAACELWCAARTGVLEWRFEEQHTRGRISGDVVGAALRRDRHSNKQNWRFIGKPTTLIESLWLSIPLNSTSSDSIAPKCYRKFVARRTRRPEIREAEAALTEMNGFSGWSGLWKNLYFISISFWINFNLVDKL